MQVDALQLPIPESLPTVLQFILIGLAATIFFEFVKPNFTAKVATKEGRMFLLKQCVVAIGMAIILAVFTKDIRICIGLFALAGLFAYFEERFITLIIEGKLKIPEEDLKKHFRNIFFLYEDAIKEGIVEPLRDEIVGEIQADAQPALLEEPPDFLIEEDGSGNS